MWWTLKKRPKITVCLCFIIPFLILFFLTLYFCFNPQCSEKNFFIAKWTHPPISCTACCHLWNGWAEFYPTGHLGRKHGPPCQGQSIIGHARLIEILGELHSIPIDKSTMGLVPSHLQHRKQAFTVSLIYNSVFHEHRMHGFGMWEERIVQEENPHKHRESKDPT